MADPDAGNDIFWFRPDPRAILPLDAFHVPRDLRKVVRRDVFDVVYDHDFSSVIRACAERPSTWISDEIISAYTDLHSSGYAHSVECRIGGELVGGLYGVAIGGAFFGESMFHRASNASKVALVHLVERLRRGGFVLLDTQYATPHLSQFGLVEIPADAYEKRLHEALQADARW